ncbi:MAG: hypothetical protein RMM31_00260 [Anaerolineae bacterium]|nr:hypothetical protein [Anaerolineae bacterium]
MGTRGARRRLLYAFLVGIILITIPCYLIGFGALLILRSSAPSPSAQVSPTALLPTFVLVTQTPTPKPIAPTATPVTLLMPLPSPTPSEVATRYIPATPTDLPTFVPTLDFATATPVLGPTATFPFIPTPISEPTFTPTPEPTATPEPTPTPALASATETPTPVP